MGRIGFWQLLLDDRLSYWEAQRINEASDAADMAAVQAESAQAASMAADMRLSQLGREVVMLRTALTVLTRTLVDTNVLDKQLLDARLEAAMEEAMASMPKPPASIASMNAVLTQPTAATAARTVTCLRCRKQVPASSTLMTADGPICERCPA